MWPDVASAYNVRVATNALICGALHSLNFNSIVLALLTLDNAPAASVSQVITQDITSLLFIYQLNWIRILQLLHLLFLFPGIWILLTRPHALSIQKCCLPYPIISAPYHLSFFLHHFTMHCKTTFCSGIFYGLLQLSVRAHSQHFLLEC